MMVFSQVGTGLPSNRSQLGWKGPLPQNIRGHTASAEGLHHVSLCSASPGLLHALLVRPPVALLTPGATGPTLVPMKSTLGCPAEAEWGVAASL